MEQIYRKDSRTGVVNNISDQEYQRYLQNKDNVKKLIASKRELDDTKRQLNKLQDDVSTMKDMLQQLLKAKDV